MAVECVESTGYSEGIHRGFQGIYRFLTRHSQGSPGVYFQGLIGQEPGRETVSQWLVVTVVVTCRRRGLGW